VRPLVPLRNRPVCPEHPVSQVQKYGFYGPDGHERQRWRCVPPDGSRPHEFVEATSSYTSTADGHLRHAGPSKTARATRRFAPDDHQEQPDRA